MNDPDIISFMCEHPQEGKSLCVNTPYQIVSYPFVIFNKALRVSKYAGWKFVLTYGIKRVFGYAAAWLFDIKNYSKSSQTSKGSFNYCRKSIDYINGSYNFFQQSERKLEIPLALYFYNKYDQTKVLEVGNVLQHYIQTKHLIVDKYEHDKNVLNIDIADFTPGRKFDFIVSISTIEHVGKEDFSSDPHKAVYIIDKMKNWLSDSGLMMITFGLGYNKYLDKQLFNGKLSLDTVFYKRISSENLWIETDANEAKKSVYGFPYPCANCVAVCFYQKA